MPEVAGKDAILIDPTQPEDIAEMILSVLNNTELRAKTIAYGIERAAQFSWKKTANQVLDIYREVLNK